MPISRYEIRNEYSLADSEVYRAADKDDPEALLEGVSMAGLVGLLRQLGDLAEFATGIFHNLHEELTVTAARGHSLMSRVQQLETEIPSIERASLSQTDHSSFFNQAGVDWHPNLRLDQNLVTQGNLPGFLMDSYEESRAPPRLFLLDKFDVAGAGACLKRYTDPSFFKVETSEMIGVDIQREKKVCKGKKKGPHRRNGGTTEVLTTTHSKLHQLFLEERAENGVRNPSLRVKLKRRLNGFPFDMKAGKSYMEKLLKSPSPDHKVLREVNVNSSLMTSVTNDHKEFGFETFEARRSPPPSPYGEENVLNPSMYEPNKLPINDELFEVPNSSYPSTATYGISSVEKAVAVDAQSHKEDSLTGYRSDDIASEIDNYVDAPSSIESEMDGDSESRLKSGLTSSIFKSESFFSDADEEHLRTRSTDSQPNGGSRKSYEYPSTSVENPQEENFSAKGFDASPYQQNAGEDLQVDHQSRPLVSDNTCTLSDAVNLQRSEIEQATSNLCSNKSTPALSQSDSEDVRKCNLKTPGLDEMVSTLNDKEEKSNLVTDHPRSPSLCDFESQSGDDSPGSSDGELLVDKPNDDIYYRTPDSSLNTSLSSLHEDVFDGKDQNSVDHKASTLSILNGLSSNVTPETISSKNQITHKLENEVPEVPDNSPDYPDTAHSGYGLESAYSKEDNHIDGLYDEDSNGTTDSSNHFPSIMRGSSYGSIDSNVENNHSNSSINDQIGSENSPDRPTEGLDAHAGDVIPEETTKKETLAQVVGSQGIGLTHHVFRNDLEAPESSFCIPEDLEEPPGTEDTVEMDGISAVLISVNNSDADKSDTTDVPAVYDNESLSMFVEEHDICFEDSGTDGLEDSENYPSECHEESDIVEKVGPTEASASGFETDLCNSVNDGHPKSESSSIFPSSNLVLEVNHDPKMEQHGVDREQESPNQSGLESHAPGPEESIAQEKVGLPLIPLDQELVHPGDTSSELSHLLPINQQPMLDHAVLPPNNPFPETNHKNLPDLPPLPPLPPVEWRMGKLQHASSSIEGEMVGPQELSSQLIFPLIVSSDHVDLSQSTASPNVINFSPEEKIHHTLTETYQATASKEENVENRCSSLEVSTLHETTLKSKKEQQQFVFPISEGVLTSAAEEDVAGIYPETASKKENVENSSSNLEANTLHETTDLPPKFENEDTAKNWNLTVKLQWPRNPLIEDVAVLNKSNIRKVTERFSPEIHKDDERDSTLHETTGLPPNSEKEKQQFVIPISEGVSTSAAEEDGAGIYPETASEKENVENSSSNFEANTLHETTDLPPKIVNVQKQFVVPISEGVSTSAAEEDTAKDGNRTVKLQWPRNPLIEDVAVLNKSKLRKVTERVRPEILKVDERDSFLNQIRTKSFNLRPAAASRPSIRGPNTNLQVAAILEKANSIRQAFAGSDEDDSDSWSD